MKTLFKFAFVAAIVAVVGYNVYQSQSVMNGMSEFALANVEALADDNENGEENKYCTIHIKCFNYNGQTTGEYTADSYTGEMCTYSTPHEHSCAACSSR